MKAMLFNILVVVCGLACGVFVVAVSGCDSDDGILDTNEGLTDLDPLSGDVNFGEPRGNPDEPLVVDGVVPQEPLDADPIVVPQQPLVVEDGTRVNDGVETAAERFAEIEANEPSPTVVQGYDPANEITMHEAVLGKRLVKLEDGSTGVVVRLQPGGDFIEALIGTVTFLADNDIDVGIADRILITGPVVEIEGGKRMILAREMTWGDHKLELRNKDGEPNW